MNQEMDQILQEEVALGYRPNTPLEMLWAGGEMPTITLRRDLEFMQMHPIVLVALEYYKAGLSGAEFWGGPNLHDPRDSVGQPISENQDVADFVLSTMIKLWHYCMPKMQDVGYPYGWAPGEHVYAEIEGKLCWSYMRDFHPHDAYMLTSGFKPVGIRVKGVRDKGDVDLWLASNSVPAKAAWYAHRARHGSFYGRSQLLGAWRPWRRLGWRDGVEQVIDAAIYRGGYSGPIVKHPMESSKTAREGVPATSDGRRDARDVARQIVEHLKAGAGLTMSSAHYPQSQGGGPKWEVIWPESVMDVTPLVKAANYMEDQIFYGTGVPPELIRASGTGSGYSGRNIPREAFLGAQQRVADAFVNMFVDQVIRPLVLTNFGDVPFTIACKSLLHTQVMDKQPMDPSDRPRTPDGKFAPKGTQDADTGSTLTPGQ